MFVTTIFVTSTIIVFVYYFCLIVCAKEILFAIYETLYEKKIIFIKGHATHVVKHRVKGQAILIYFRFLIHYQPYSLER